MIALGRVAYTGNTLGLVLLSTLIQKCGPRRRRPYCEIGPFWVQFSIGHYIVPFIIGALYSENDA